MLYPVVIAILNVAQKFLFIISTSPENKEDVKKSLGDTLFSKKAGATVIPVDLLEGKDETPQQQMEGLFKPRPVSRLSEPSRVMTPIENPNGLPDLAMLYGSKKSPSQPADSKPKKPVKEKQEQPKDKGKTPEKPQEDKGKNKTPEKPEMPEDDDKASEMPEAINVNPINSVPPRGNLVRVKTPDIQGDKDTRFTECPFAEFGCTMTGEALQVRRHIRDEAAMHLSQMCAAVLEMSNQTKKAVADTADTYRESEETVQRVRQIGSLYSSQFVWRINGYSASFANARRGRPAIIYSAPFFSHRQGYKLAVAMALYGDGDVEATVTPRITDNNMPFLGRPHSDRNPAFGIKTFTDLRMMETDNGSFVVNDACFIKVDIDLAPIYKYIG